MQRPDVAALDGYVGVLSPAAAGYVQAIFTLHSDGETVRPGRLAEWLGVSAPSVSQAMARLIRDGLVCAAHGQGVVLTPLGVATAQHIVRQRRIAESWLCALGLDGEAADEESRHVAFFLSGRVLKRLHEQLGQPATCPHGNVIPDDGPDTQRQLAPGGVVNSGSALAG